MQVNQLLTQEETAPTGLGTVGDTWTADQYQTAETVRLVNSPVHPPRIRIGTTDFEYRLSNSDALGWLALAVAELNRVFSLPADWDSYGAVPVNQQTLAGAFIVLIDLMEGRSTLPKISASVAGGVEFEWHQPGLGLEIEVRAPSMIHAYFYDDDNPNAEWEDDVAPDHVILLGPFIDQVAV